MSPSAALLICLAVTASAAANGEPSEEITAELVTPPPVYVGVLPLDDPPEISDGPTGEQQTLDDAGGQQTPDDPADPQSLGELTGDHQTLDDSTGAQQAVEFAEPSEEEPAPEIVETVQPVVVEEDGLRIADFKEEHQEEGANDILEDSEEVADEAKEQKSSEVLETADDLVDEDAPEEYEQKGVEDHFEHSKHGHEHETHDEHGDHHPVTDQLPREFGKEEDQESQDNPENAEDEPVLDADFESVQLHTPTARLQINVPEKDESHTHSGISKNDNEHGTGLKNHESSLSEQLPEEIVDSLHALQRLQSRKTDTNAESGMQKTASAAVWHAPDSATSGSIGMISPPVSFSVKEGGSLILPCDRAALTRRGGLETVWWYHSARLLLGGKGPVSSDGRYSLLADGSLRLSAAVPQDGGVFTCRVYGAGGEVTESSRHVLVQTEAQTEASKGTLAATAPSLQVVTEPADGVRAVERGQATSLACWAPGQPSATVTWTKQEGVLPYGESMLKGPRLEIGQVAPAHRGTYRCTVSTADNRTAVRSLRLQVNFSPEVTALDPVVYAGEDQQAVLRCKVLAYPPPKVIWRRSNGRALRPAHHLVSQEGNTFRLAMLVQADDLDTYICSAANAFGSAEATVVLTGRPGRPVVTSSNHGSEPRSYTLRWRAPGVTPPLAYKLIYRRQLTDASRPIGYWRTAWLETVVPLEDASQEKEDEPDDDDGEDDDDRHYEYVIRGLKPDSEYEVHVLVQNRHGWSEPSESFLFRTAHEAGKESGVHQERHGVADAPGGNSASDMRVGSATLLLGAAVGVMIRL